MIGKAGRDFAASAQVEQRLAKGGGEATTVRAPSGAFDPTLAQGNFARRGDAGVAELVYLNASVKSTRRQNSGARDLGAISEPVASESGDSLALLTDQEDDPGAGA
jgi:hypothetical protein